MNVGFSEAASLVGTLRNILRDKASVSLLEAYGRERQEEWRRLLGLAGGLKVRGSTNPWVSQHRTRILPCLPASDGDLTRLAAQLQLDF